MSGRRAPDATGSGLVILGVGHQWLIGAVMTLTASALGAAGAGLGQLASPTPREAEVLRLVARGHSGKGVPLTSARPARRCGAGGGRPPLRVLLRTGALA